MLEELPWLWDIFDSVYAKQEKRDSACKEIAERLGREVNEMKSKTNNLCAQLGWETIKVKKIKSGWTSNELCKPSRIHWERLQFLTNQMQSTGTQDTVDIQNTGTELNDTVYEIEKNIQSKAKLKHKKSKKKS